LGAKSWNPWKLVEGADGLSSTSKLQWLLWIVVILFAYVILWVIRAKEGDYSAISAIPTNLLAVLGFSTGTAAAAKGITSGYVQSGRSAKVGSAQGATGGVMTDDTGVPELAKVQMVGFTLVAVGIFLATLIHQLVHSPVVTTLPNIDASLLVLMGISQGGYLGKKLVTFGSPTLFPPLPVAAPAPGAVPRQVTVQGSSLGDPGAALQPPGSKLLLDGVPIPVSDWNDTQIVFMLDADSPKTGNPWPRPTKAQLQAITGGQTSNSVSLEIS